MMSNDRSGPDPVPPIPTLLTQVDDATINKVINAFVNVGEESLPSGRVPKMAEGTSTPGSMTSRKAFTGQYLGSTTNRSSTTPEKQFKNENNLFPVERLGNGGFGVPLTTLGMVIKKLHNQMYGTKHLVTVGTQTLTHEKWLDQSLSLERSSPRKLPKQQALDNRKRNEFLLKAGYNTSRQVLQQRVRSFGHSLLSKTVNNTDRSVGNQYQQYKTTDSSH